MVSLYGRKFETKRFHDDMVSFYDRRYIYLRLQVSTLNKEKNMRVFMRFLPEYKPTKIKQVRKEEISMSFRSRKKRETNKNLPDFIYTTKNLNRNLQSFPSCPKRCWKIKVGFQGFPLFSSRHVPQLATVLT